MEKQFISWCGLTIKNCELWGHYQCQNNTHKLWRGLLGAGGTGDYVEWGWMSKMDVHVTNSSQHKNQWCGNPVPSQALPLKVHPHCHTLPTRQTVTILKYKVSRHYKHWNQRSWYSIKQCYHILFLLDSPEKTGRQCLELMSTGNKDIYV